MPQKYFNAFICGFPHLWSPEHLWFSDNVPWECFKPFVEAFNQTRCDLLTTVYLLMDESMSAWRPKTTKTGGLPNITYEPRKPKPLGTMLRNGVKATTGIMVTQDIVEGADAQREKRYTGEESSLPQREPIMVHVAETLRQCESANVTRGGWVGGDAWFGSVPCVVELKNKLGIFSTFIIKQNKQYCPLQVIHRIMRARYSNGRCAGKHVVMKAKISGVDLFLLAYAWSNQRMAYIVSSCGTTVQHEVPYRTHFTDDFGNVTFKEIPRPSIAHFYFELCPLIDNHNKDRQGVLGLKDCWPTKNPWFRLMTTLIGMSVVDLHRWDRNKRCDGAAFEWTGGDDERPDFLRVRSMANYIGKGLLKLEMRYYHTQNPRQQPRVRQIDRLQPRELERIIGKDGHISRPAAADGKKGGRGYLKGCLICRQYQEKQQNTNWWCSACRAPLCKINRGRELTCYEEHMQRRDDEVVGCFERNNDYFKMPREYKLYKNADFPTLPAFDVSATNSRAMENIITLGGGGDGDDGNKDGDGNDDDNGNNKSSSDSESSGDTLLHSKPVAKTKQGARKRNSQATIRKSKRLAGGNRKK